MQRHDEAHVDRRADQHVRTALDRAERRRRSQLIGLAVGVAVLIAIAVPVVALSMWGGGAKQPEQQTAKYEPIPLTAEQPAPKPAAPTEPQRLRIDIGESGYEPFEVKARADAPIILTVGKGEGCAAGFLIPALDVEKDNSTGPVTFSLGKVKAGTYAFTCGMAMIEGRLVVR